MAESIFERTNNIKTIANNTRKEEVLNYADALRAKQIVLNGEIKNTEDAYLFCAALNFLNAYVKKSYAPSDFKRKYFFKDFVSKVIDKIVNHNLKNCTFSFGGNVVMVNIANLLFSFHNADSSETMRVAKSKNHPSFLVEKWKGVRLQPIAHSVFESAKSMDNLSTINSKIIAAIPDNVVASEEQYEKEDTVKFENKMKLVGAEFSKKKNKNHKKSNSKNGCREC